MKKRSRDINIFNMSALDLFASALGAFILLGVLLLPYFPNTGDSPQRVADLRAQLENQAAEHMRLAQQVEQLQEQLQQSQARVAQLERQAARANELEARLQQSQAQLQQTQDALRTAQRKKYLLVVISWNTQDDVDLHVTDPAGREFYYERKTHPGTPAKLEEDNIRGPGNEIWLHPEVTPGDYQIHYKLFTRRTRAWTHVRGLILYPNGRREIPTWRLARQNDKPLIAVVRMDAQGNPSVRFR